MNKFLLLFMLLFPLRSWSQDGKTTIVFVCEHGGARSTIASTYFNKLAKENDLPYQSVFRGLTPDSVITKETRKGLSTDGFETTGLSPTQLSIKDVTSGTVLISLDCNPPSLYQAYQTWKGIPPISENYEVARDEIVKRLKRLVRELKKRSN